MVPDRRAARHHEKVGIQPFQLDPTQPYVAYYDLPKIEHLERLFPEFYRDKPVLVSQADVSD